MHAGLVDQSHQVAVRSQPVDVVRLFVHHNLQLAQMNCLTSVLESIHVTTTVATQSPGGLVAWSGVQTQRTISAWRAYVNGSIWSVVHTTYVMMLAMFLDQPPTGAVARVMTAQSQLLGVWIM